MARLLLVLALVLAACATTPTPPTRVLVFSHSTGYRHNSIPDGVAAVTRLAEQEGWQVTATEDPAVFTADTLRPYAIIVLVSTTTKKEDPASEWFAGERREALQGFVRSGGGIVGIHGAADSHYHWPWYRRMLGGAFQRHPPRTPRGRLHVEVDNHPSTRGLPQLFERVDEWYVFDDYEVDSELLLTIDPAATGEPNWSPAAWARTFEGGRVFYTAMGHTRESFSEPLFLRHLRGGMRWAASRTP